MAKTSVPLTALRRHARAVIDHVQGPDAEYLSGYGLCSGTMITVRQTFPSYVIKADETELAIEAEVAARIIVSPFQ